MPDDAEIETAEDVDNRLIPHLHRKVGDFAVAHPVVDPEAPLSDALWLLAEGYIRLPVVGPDRKLVGSLSSLTILRRFRFLNRIGKKTTLPATGNGRAAGDVVTR